VKRAAVFLLVLALMCLPILWAGCGGSDDGPGDNGKTNGDFDRTEYDRGYEDGQLHGYDQGYADGKKGSYSPEILEEADADDYYALGYNEGWAAGYEEGYDDAAKELDDTKKEMAEVEAAMLAFVKQNSAPGLEFKIENIVIHGDEAAGIAVCTSETLESPLVVMEKGPSGWSPVDFGTGIEPPSWYPY
jgi:hypothetical protein